MKTALLFICFCANKQNRDRKHNQKSTGKISKCNDNINDGISRPFLPVAQRRGHFPVRMNRDPVKAAGDQSGGHKESIDTPNMVVGVVLPEITSLKMIIVYIRFFK